MRLLDDFIITSKCMENYFKVKNIYYSTIEFYLFALLCFALSHCFTLFSLNRLFYLLYLICNSFVRLGILVLWHFIRHFIEKRENCKNHFFFHVYTSSWRFRRSEYKSGKTSQWNFSHWLWLNIPTNPVAMQCVVRLSYFRSSFFRRRKRKIVAAPCV